jgi:hypothetical protein
VSIPVASTTIAVARSDQDGTKDDYDGVSFASVASRVRAVIGSPSGAETVMGGSSEDVSAQLTCDPVSLRHDDRVTDETTGDQWQVVWVRRRIGLGLDHVSAGLRAITDRAG